MDIVRCGALGMKKTNAEKQISVLMEKGNDMGDLISKNEAVKIAKGFTFTFAEERQRYMDFLEYCLNNAPTVDAVPAVHGKWKRKTDYDENDNAIFECSNCMSSDVHAKSTIVPFCWYCGARMDGE